MYRGNVFLNILVTSVVSHVYYFVPGSPTSSLFSASTQFITTLQRVYYLSVFTSVSASISNSNQKVSLQPAHFRVGTAETLII